MKTTDSNNEIHRGGRVERYETVDGLEMFLGYVHTCPPRPYLNVHPALTAEWDARLGPV